MTAHRKISPLTVSAMPAVRRFRCVPAERILDNRNPIAGTAGKTYPGSFDFENEKNNRQKPTQLRVRYVSGLTWRVFENSANPFPAATIVSNDHGTNAMNRMGI